MEGVRLSSPVWLGEDEYSPSVFGDQAGREKPSWHHIQHFADVARGMDACASFLRNDPIVQPHPVGEAAIGGAGLPGRSRRACGLLGDHVVRGRGQQAECSENEDRQDDEGTDGRVLHTCLLGHEISSYDSGGFVLLVHAQTIRG